MMASADEVTIAAKRARVMSSWVCLPGLADTTLDLSLVGWRVRPPASWRARRGSCFCAGAVSFNAGASTVGVLVNRINRSFFDLFTIARFPQRLDPP
jgi:hypothetical protein